MLGQGQETPFRELKVELGGLGVGTICQLVPSQRSATVAEVTAGGFPKVAWPTAIQEFADEQSTASKLVLGAPSTFGVGGTVQAADAAEGVSNSAVTTIKTRRDGRSDIRTATLRRGQTAVKGHRRPLGRST